MKLSDLKTSKFLKKEDVTPPVRVTISGFEKFNVAMEGAEPDNKWGMHLKELEKPLIINQTNGQILSAITGSEDSEDWVGLTIELYNDPNIFFGGKMTGGIRVRPVEAQPKAAPKSTIDTSAADDLVEYGRLPKPTIIEQGLLKKICAEGFGDPKCGIKNRLVLWKYINLDRWPQSEEEAQSLISQIKLAGGDLSDIPF
jgi:hypothetical protein